MLRNTIALGLAVAVLSGCSAGEVATGPAGGGLDARLAKHAEESPPGQNVGGGGVFSFGHTYKSIRIESDPTGALIAIDGQGSGTTPQDIRVDDDRRTIQVILSKPGYLAKVEELDLTNLAEPITVIYANLMPRN